MIPKLLCLLDLLGLLMQGREASIVPVVETIREITVTIGEEGLLKCAYERQPYAVFWGFRSGSSSSDLLLVKHQFYPVGKRSGPGYDEGRFNITDDYYLVIHNVSVEDEGRYICNVADLKTGQVLRNYTNVAVIVHALKPLVRIHQCGSNYLVSLNVTDNPKASCMIHITRSQQHVQLDCFVEGAKPQADMFWVDNNTPQGVLNGTSLTTTMGTREGTVDQKLTVIIEVSEFQSEQEYYFTCIAEGPAVGGKASVTVGINKVPPGDGESRERLDNERVPLNETVPDKRSLLLDKRKKIKDFSPMTPTSMDDYIDQINLGVFGLGKAGKSSLINSLIFSLTGNYPGETDNRATTHNEGDITGQKEEIELTDHIHLLNYKGMVKCDPTKREEILSQIKGKPIQNISSVPVDCAIFICDYRNREGRYVEFMKLLSKDVGRYFGRGIMLVIPNKGDLKHEDDTIKAAMSKTIGIPKDHVWIFNNYTLESHEEDEERSIQFLDFILHCLIVAEENQQFRDIHEGDESCNTM